MWQLVPHGRAASLGVFSEISGIDCRHFLRSPHPLALLLIFCTPSHTVLFPSHKFLGMPAMQTIRDVCRCLHSEDALDVFLENIIHCTVIANYSHLFYMFACVLLSCMFSSLPCYRGATCTSVGCAWLEMLNYQVVINSSGMCIEGLSNVWNIIHV